MKCDEFNMTNSMCKMQWDNCNVRNTIRQIQYAKWVLKILCDKYKATNAKWQM